MLENRGINFIGRDNHFLSTMLNMKKILFLLLASYIGVIQAQNCLQNRSLEGPPMAHVVPVPWFTCGGTADTQPGNWGINVPPSDGSSYISCLQVGDDPMGYFEGAGQAFDTCLTTGSSYTYSIDLAHSNIFNTASPGNCYSSMQVWLGNAMCGEDELVWQSGKITSTAWQTYTFSFIPTQDWCYINFRPYWIDDCSGFVNVLMDNLVCLTSVSITTTDNICNSGCEGMATATSFTGVAPFMYQWNDPANQTTQAATGLCSGAYMVIITDSAGQVDSGHVTIAEPDSLVAYTTVVEDICNACNQTATVTMSTGVPPFTYSWNDPLNQDTVTATGLCENGTYIVTVTDSNGCNAIDSVSFGAILNSPTITVLSVTSANCTQADGGACITVTGGTPPNTYLWDDPDSATTNCLTLVPTGSYNVTVTDSMGCTISSTVAVSESDSITLVTLIDDSIICSVDSTMISVIAAGGLSPYTFIWDNGLGNGANHAVSPSATTTYQVVTVDDAGCSSDTGSITVMVLPPLSLTLALNDSLCKGDSGIIMASGNGGNGGPYMYLWDDGSTNAFLLIGPDSTTTYSVTISDNCSPDVSDSIKVEVEICLSIPQTTDLLNTLRMYPNPNTGLFNLAFDLERRQDVNIEIFSVTGRLVFQQSLHQHHGAFKQTLEMNNHVPGIYMLHIVLDKGVINRKLVIK